EVKSIVVLSGEPARVVAASQMALLGKLPQDLADPEIRNELQKALKTAAVGFHFDEDFDYHRPLSVTSSGPGGNVLQRGVVLVSLDIRHFHSEVIRTASKSLAGYVGATLIIAVCGWFFLERLVFKPLIGIGKTITAFDGTGRQPLIDTVRYSGELAQLAGAWNGLVERLQEENRERTKAQEELRRAHDELEVRVTERTRELLHSNETLQLQARVIESMTEAAIVADEAGLIVSTNPACVTVFGYERGELIGQHVSVLRNLDEAEGRRVAAETMASAQGGVSWSGEIIRRRKDGTPILVHAQIRASEVAGQRHFFAVQEDITERKRVEEALRESEGELRTLAESMPQIVWMTRPDGWVTYTNQRWLDYTGLSFEESLGHGWLSHFHPDDQQAAAEAWQRGTASGGDYYVECRVRGANGSYRWMLNRGVPFRDGTGQITKWMGTCTDIHDLKQAAEALGESEEKFRLLADNISDVFWITSPDLTIMHYVSAGYEAIWGRSMESLYARPHQWIESILPEDRDNVLAVFGTLMANEPQVSVEYRIARPDGTIRWVHDRGFQVRDAAGKLVRLTGLVSDITERKAAQDKLLRNQSLLRIAGKISRVGGWTITVPDNQIFWSSEVWDILGFPLGDEPSLETALNLYTAESREKLGAAIALCASEGRSFEMDGDMKETNGRKMWARISGEAERDARGIITRVNGAFSDITERKRSEVNLQRQQTELRVLFDLLPAMIWFKDTENGIIRVNKRVADAAGKSVEEIEGKHTREIYPGQANAFYANDLEVIRSKQPLLGLVEAFPGEDGRPGWVQTSKVPYYDEEGTVIGIVVVAEDISERMRSEESLRLLGAAVEQSKESILITDAQLDLPGPGILFVNHAFTEMTGYPAAEVLGKTPRILQGPRTDRAVLRRLRENLTRGEVFGGETVNYRKDGTEFHLEWQIAPLRDAAGIVTHYVAIQRDVTQRKAAEEALEEAHRRLQDASRRAGMAEVATSVLHNVGNVLNSVNVSCHVISDKLHKSRIPSVVKTADLLQQHAGDLGEFLTTNPIGLKLPEFLGRLAMRLSEERLSVLEEVQSLRENIGYIKDIVAMQQTYGRVCAVTENLLVTDLVEDSLRINAGALTRHKVCVGREYGDVPLIAMDKHKVLQILVNLISNAKYACDESSVPDKLITVRVMVDEDSVRISIIDNGVGISPENLTRIFSHGFTTKTDGHGFGLHGSILAAREMGGDLTVQSDGPGKGAAFTLVLPLDPSKTILKSCQ
ncbi:MAG: PAS domain S-box protein, partial [Luteolibacter sp.]